MNWLHYILEANLYLVVFYAGYYLFLRRETHYTLNRAYLLFSCVASFILPVVQLGILKPAEQPITAVHFAFTPQTVQLLPVQTAPATPVFTWDDAIIYTYLLGAAVVLVILLIKLYQLLKLTRTQSPKAAGDYRVVYIDGSDTAFSFFNYLFIGTRVQQADMIVKHELVHIRQKHSADVIFVELLKIVNWFNPFIYLLQYSLREIHEYIADEKTATSGTDALTYSSFLVNNAYGLSGSSITHSFFNYNLLKKRIIMLHQKRSGNLARLRYLLAIPICLGLLCASTLAFSKTYGWVDIGPHRINPANKSPQVAEPKSMLVVIQNGKTLVTDKFSAKRADGSTRIYTAHNLSNKDREDLKKQGIAIDVISIDTDKTHTPPPPPPAPPVRRVNFKPPHPMTVKTSKGYPFSEWGYTENGKQDITVTIQEKDGSHKSFTKSKATAEELELLKSKYGYVFPAHLKMPPPPPAPPVASIDKRPPPPSPTPPASGVDRRPPPPPPAPPLGAQNQMKPPPPPPFEHAYKDFFEYLEAYMNHSADTRKQNVTGTVVAQYTIDASQHISNVKIISGDEALSNSALSAIRSYKGAINEPAGDYKIGFDFNVTGQINGDEVRAKDSVMMAMPNFTGIISIVNPAN